MLERAGLVEIQSAFKDANHSISKSANTSPGLISGAFLKLDRFLLDLSMEMSDKLFRIQSPEIAKRVASSGSEKFLEEYKFIVGVIQDPKNEVIQV